MRRPQFIGIDPGQAGALVAIGDDGKTAIDVRWWRDQAVPPKGLALGIGLVDVVTIERPYLGKNPHAALELAEWIGRSLTLLPRAVNLYRPTAMQWRAKVFRRGRMTRAQAKRLAVKACQLHSGLADELASRHDVAEAWGMARFGWARWTALQIRERRLREDGERVEITDEVPYTRSA